MKIKCDDAVVGIHLGVVHDLKCYHIYLWQGDESLAPQWALLGHDMAVTKAISNQQDLHQQSEPTYVYCTEQERSKGFMS